MKNQKEEAPLAIYLERFSKLDPEAAAARCGAAFDGRGFGLTLLGTPLRLTWPDGAIEAPESAPKAASANSVRILLLRYLCEGVLAPGTGRFLAYRELPWGAVYDANFSGRCSRRLAGTFSGDLEGFRRACLALGGREQTLPDASFDLDFLEGLTVRVALRDGDDEFPPTSQFLFSDNIVTAFTAEDAAVIGETVIRFLTARR
jgi:hypothetical protein